MSPPCRAAQAHRRRLAVLVLPGVASAGLAPAVTRDVPLGATARSRPRRRHFHLVGVTWRGPGTVELRVRGVGGTLEHLAARRAGGGRPRRGSTEARSAAAAISAAPGGSGRPTARNSAPPAASPRSARPTSRAPRSRIPLRAPAAAVSPAIVPRAAWGADESIRRNEPESAPAIRLAVVHHTAGANDYTQAQAPAIVRAIQVFHVKQNGWNDIGYNFLVDRFGTVYEGRYGGITENVIGAHAQGFNTGSVGVAVLGTYESGGISAAAETSLAELLAWRLDLAHVDPLSTLSYLSNGNPRYPAGLPVFLRAVSGHRDTGYDVLPGRHALRPARRDRESASRAPGCPSSTSRSRRAPSGGPVRVTGPALGGVPVDGADRRRRDAVGGRDGHRHRHRGRLDVGRDRRRPRHVQLADRRRADARPLPRGRSRAPRWRGAAHGDLRHGRPRHDLAERRRQADATTITYTLTGNANVRVDVIDAGGCRSRRSSRSASAAPASTRSRSTASGLPDGTTSSGSPPAPPPARTSRPTSPVAITRTLGDLAVAPASSRPSRRRARRTSASPSRWRSRRRSTSSSSATAGGSPTSSRASSPRARSASSGTARSERGSVADGSYEVLVEASTRSARPASRQASSATRPRRSCGSSPASRPCCRSARPRRVTGVVNNARRRLEGRAGGKVRVPRHPGDPHATLFARDEAGNLTELRRPVSASRVPPPSSAARCRPPVH